MCHGAMARATPRPPFSDPTFFPIQNKSKRSIDLKPAMSSNLEALEGEAQALRAAIDAKQLGQAKAQLTKLKVRAFPLQIEPETAS